MDKIYQVFGQLWLMESNAHRQFMATALQLLKSGGILGLEQSLGSTAITSYATTPYLAHQWELDDTSLPDQSVAVIQMEGPLFSWETFRLEKLIARVEDNPRLVGLVLWINGPGGMAQYVDVVARKIRECQKPTATYVAGLMASAHFWLGTATGRTFAASPLVTVGSVGTLGTYINYRKAYEAAGIDYRTIYPEQSDLKNRWFRDIDEKDDETLVKAQLAKLDEAFCHDVALQLGIDYDAKLPLFRGEEFYGDAAVTAGYIDQIGSLQDAVAWVLAQSTIRKIKS